MDAAAERIGTRYVLSSKPNPSQLSLGKTDKEEVRRELSRILSACRRNRCSFELVLKDISTVNGNPRCLFDWEKTAMEMVCEYEGF